MRQLISSALLFSFTLSACTAPRFAGEQRIAPRNSLPPRKAGAPLPTAEPNSIPTAADVVLHVQCELQEILKDDRFPTFRSQKFIVFATLTLEVTNAGGANPALSFIDPLKTIGGAARKRSLGLAGKYVQTAHRTYSQTFVLDLSSPVLGEDSLPIVDKRCTDAADGPKHPGIRGGLAIAETVAEGMTNSRFLFKAPSASLAGLPQATIPTFGATIDFTLLWNGGFNPGWSLIHFSGPSGSGGNLLDFSRTTKDTLTLSFASAGPRLSEAAVAAKVRDRLNFLALPANSALPRQTEAQIRAQVESEDEQASAQSKAAAAAAAQDSVTRLLLQRIVPIPNP
ncbi:hypothetical protein SAMN05518849_11431 [Sphingobium sp. AP50]|uniref:hypothetical protein n=1 Tax=Sphingobium sp. AP50 TaxID=1884369 RepID=UPI0008B1F2F7|nr:hypothetical protein [Sphingobium sp. AP50]SEJ80563.1 hypothetical protein SAMN05518849_11431 [Sphingobium sp. AP50]